LLGPTLAGFVIALGGPETCFLLNALSYLAVIGALLAMRVPARETPPHRPVWQGLREGLVYTLGFPPLRILIVLAGMAGLVAMPYTVLMPLFADRVLGGGPEHGALYLAWLMTASGVGSVTGAVYLASRPSVLGLGRHIIAGGLLFSGGVMAFSASRSLWLSLPLLTLSSLGLMVQLASTNTIVQTIVDDAMRGRVMSLYTTAFTGMAPFGSLLAGSLAEAVGVQTAVLLCGAVFLACTLAFATQRPALRRFVRPIYVQRGILSEPAAEAQVAPAVEGVAVALAPEPVAQGNAR
jgi:MFS family permease